jgi:hypothetical protein
MTLDEWFEKAKGALRETAQACADKSEQWAKQNHPWRNRTYGAEEELTGYVQDTGGKIGFGVAQGVEYGKYLETAHDGKYAVCEKAINQFVPSFNAQIEKVLKVKATFE